jgi:hypothetical protein
MGSLARRNAHWPARRSPIGQARSLCPSAEQLVPAARDDGGAGPQRGAHVRLGGQQRVGCQQPATDVGDDRDTEAGQLADLHAAREPLDPEVARVHLEHAAGVGPDGVGVVAQRGAVGGADLAQPGSGGRDEVGQPEPVA